MPTNHLRPSREGYTYRAILPYLRLLQLANQTPSEASFNTLKDSSIKVPDGYTFIGLLTDNQLTEPPSSPKANFFPSAKPSPSSQKFSENCCAINRSQLGIKTSLFSAYIFQKDKHFVIALVVQPIITQHLTQQSHIDPFLKLLELTADGPSDRFYKRINDFVSRYLDDPQNQFTLIGYESGGDLAATYAIQLIKYYDTLAKSAAQKDPKAKVLTPDILAMSFENRGLKFSYPDFESTDCIHSFLIPDNMINTCRTHIGRVFTINLTDTTRPATAPDHIISINSFESNNKKSLVDCLSGQRNKESSEEFKNFTVDAMPSLLTNHSLTTIVAFASSEQNVDQSLEERVQPQHQNLPGR